MQEQEGDQSTSVRISDISFPGHGQRVKHIVPRKVLDPVSERETSAWHKGMRQDTIKLMKLLLYPLINAFAFILLLN